MCCRLANEDYFDSDEEKIQIDYITEPGNTKSQTPSKTLHPPRAVIPSTIPLYLLLSQDERNLENIRKLRNVKRKIELKDIPKMFQSIKSTTPEKESSDIRQHRQTLSCHYNIDFFCFSAEFLLEVLSLINNQNSMTLDRCSDGYRCVAKSRFVLKIGSGVTAPNIQYSFPRCSFLGSLDARKNNNQQQAQLSKLIDTLRPSLNSCRGKGKSKRDNFVCCKADSFDINTRRHNERLKVEHDQQDAFYEYEEWDESEYEYYDEENDLNFDKVLIYSHINAPGGR